MRKASLVVALVLLVSAPVTAATLCMSAASADLAPSATASADLKHNDGGSQQYWTSDFDPATDEPIILTGWFYPDANPATVTAIVWWKSASGTSTNDVIFDVSIGCAGATVEWDTLVFSTPVVSVTDAGLATAGLMNATSATGAITPAGSAANVPCALKINRDADNVGDTLAVDAQVVGVCLTY